jgi:hypothetical protein
LLLLLLVLGKRWGRHHSRHECDPKRHNLY